MGKKEVIVMNLTPRVEEMEGARRATGISSTAVLHGYCQEIYSVIGKIFSNMRL